jgi:acyl carrier protein
MIEDAILAKVRELIVTVKQDTDPVSAEAVQPWSSLAGPPLSMDSLDFARFLAYLEEAFDITADDSDFLHLDTVGASVRLVADLLAGAVAGHDSLKRASAE